MRILVLSDSHSGLSFMRRCIKVVRPDAVIHLGDYFDDGAAMAEENEHIVFHQVPGNCDRYRCSPFQKQILCYPVGGAMLYMTHGHMHRVKSGIEWLLRDARAAGAQAALYGHTHIADCHREADGLWVLNPGSCGSFSGSAGLMEVKDNKIIDCKIIHQADLEELV